MLIGNVNSFTQNQLQRTTSAIARSLERLSAGLRVNSPADDPAAYGLSVSLDAQARGFQQAILNANEGIGMVSTAEAAFQTQLDLLQKMHELALQASNGTYSTQDRANLNTEFQDLLSEFQRITNNTQFNGTKLLDGSFGSRTLQIGATSNSANQMNVQIDSIQTNTAFQKTIGTGTFQSIQTLTAVAGMGVYQPVVADLNGDGIPDIVESNGSGSVMEIYLGTGGGNYASPKALQAGNTPLSSVVTDVNGDGIPDIVAGDYGDADISVFIGNGDGTFKTRKTFSNGGGFNPWGVVAGDFNHDGKMDIASGNSGQIGIFIGNGDGTFQAVQTMAAGAVGGGINMVATDLNGDGNLDFIAGNWSGSSANVWLGNGNGSFQSRTTVALGTNPYSIAVGDLNKDGKLDFVAANQGSNNISIRMGNGDGTFSVGTTITGTTTTQAVQLADFNGDGALDIVESDSTGTAVYLGNGDGTFQSRVTLNTHAGIYVAAADLNNDGVQDVLTANGSLYLNFGNTQSVSAAVNLNLTTQSNSEYVVGILNTTITYLQKEQANVAAVHSRLEENVANNLLAADSLDQAKENATNVDVALETSNLVRNQILQNGATAVLAQANLNEQVVLQLLKFQ